jgi:hypothetical protein
MEFKELAKEIKKVFDAKQYEWRIDGILSIPTELDIRQTMEEMAKQLANVPDGTWMELGRLIFIKSGKLIDVYVHHAAIEENEQANKEPVL